MMGDGERAGPYWDAWDSVSMEAGSRCREMLVGVWRKGADTTTCGWDATASVKGKTFIKIKKKVYKK